MSDLSIKVFPRAERGKQNKKIRKNKFVPAVVYGQGQKSLALSLDIREAEKYSKKEFENKIFSFESEDKELKGLKVIKKSLSRHKVSQQPIHLDFLSLDMKKPLRVHVDIHFKGQPKGVKEEGGIFNISLRSVELECLPGDIPPAIELDVSHLALNQSLHISDLRLPKNIKRISKGQRALCAIVPAKEEEEKPTAVEEEAKAGTEPENKPSSAEKPKEKNKA